MDEYAGIPGDSMCEEGADIPGGRTIRVKIDSEGGIRLEAALGTQHPRRSLVTIPAELLSSSRRTGADPYAALPEGHARFETPTR